MVLIEQARRLARALRVKHGARSALRLAGWLGIEVEQQRWRVAEGRVRYFAECTRQPLRIVLNEAALELGAPDEAAQLREIVIAHELGHLLLPQPAAWAKHSLREAAAHAFAQELTGWPFDPAHYEHLLREQK